MTETTAAAPDASAISPVGALVGTFSNPAETFRRLVATPPGGCRSSRPFF